MDKLGSANDATMESAETAAPVRLTEEELAALRFPRNSRPAPLTSHTIDWILYLPAEVRPQALSGRYPRIANLLADAWLRPQQFKLCLNEFLHDKRPNRQGFPPEVAVELQKLENHFNRLQYSAWDSNA